MPNYQNSKIYKLICDNPELVYYGSTTQKYLASRLSGHHQGYKKKVKGHNDCSSYKLFEAGNVKIILVESFPCKTKEELLYRERYWIENNSCVNMCKPITTKEEQREQRKQYQIDNREHILEKKREYSKKTKEQKREYDRINYQKNREQKINQVKNYYKENCEKVKEYRKSYYHSNK